MAKGKRLPVSVMSERFWRLALAIAVLLSLGGPSHHTPLVRADDLASAVDLFNLMSIEERVGQLFLVTFEGSSAGQGSDIADLILNYHVGGALLLAKNDNFSDISELGSVPLQVVALTNELQRLAITGTPAIDLPESDTAINPDLPLFAPSGDFNSIPIFVAIGHEGDGYPYSNILSGLTEIPNNMTIGATWQPQYAETVGEIVGQELSAIGINMLLGPSLDVLEKPSPFSPGQPGIRSFGGDPYWVGLMGEAYTQGVHQGSNGRLAAIATHFPGNGSSDRPVDEEVPTVRKSLEQLKQIELAPFFAVTDLTKEPGAIVDGLLTTHIRYQGFQGNIRATTNPISFDRQALANLMQLPEFDGWRNNGGVMVSDSLGVRSVERFFDDTEQEFPHRRVAKDALLAGNDLLYLADFALGEAPYEDQLNNIKDTILWFQEIYTTDQPFQQRVDQAVLQILRLKLRLYDDDFSLPNTQVQPEEIPAKVGQGETAMLDLAQAALTLISPSQAELTERLDRPPGPDDRITIFTDVREFRQCSDCPLQALIGETALEERILALYGPTASEQVRANQIQSFSMLELQAFVDAGPGVIPLPSAPISPTLVPEFEETPDPTAPTPTPITTPTPPPAYLVQEALASTDWIIFATLATGEPTTPLKELLAQRPDIVRNSKIIVFAYHAPYYLDTTEISKLTAYFAAYSRTKASIDASVRALFQEALFNGKPPVDVAGIRYDLFTQTQPDPGQMIELNIVTSGEPQAPPSEAPLEASVGDTLRLQAGIIRDHNGHPVPDGTIVQFVQEDRIQGLISIIAEIPTADGVAQLDYVLEARTGAGQFRITARTGEATVSQEVDISIEDEAQVAIITPTPMPTPTPTLTPTPTPTPTASPTPMPSPTGTAIAPAPQSEEPGIRIELSEFQLLIAVFMGLLITANVGLSVGRRQHCTLEQRISWPLWGIVGGLLLYIYYQLQLPGTEFLFDLGSWAGLLATLVGGFAGLTIFQIGIWLSRPRPTAGTEG
jgi:beta-N-acetylhexosaminidase